jgi:hypothetical protein
MTLPHNAGAGLSSINRQAVVAEITGVLFSQTINGPLALANQGTCRYQRRSGPAVKFNLDLSIIL